MGMNAKEIYIELWNRSDRNSDADFELLINTRDYDAIQTEIVKKLKKSSISFVKVHKIESDCL